VATVPSIRVVKSFNYRGVLREFSNRYHFSGGTPTGDVAALVRYSTASRTEKNHPLYLFNYYHSALMNNSLATIDQLNTAQRTAMGTYASAWISGFSDGGHTCIRCGPNGDVATGQLVNLLLTHRDFPRG
jgi:hypothetical protein